MAKPICVMYYNPDVVVGKNNAGLNEMNKMMDEKFPDYHTFAIPSQHSNDGSCEDIRFEVFNADKIDAVSLEQFKHEILKTVVGV